MNIEYSYGAEHISDPVILRQFRLSAEPDPGIDPALVYNPEGPLYHCLDSAISSTEGMAPSPDQTLIPTENSAFGQSLPHPNTFQVPPAVCFPGGNLLPFLGGLPHFVIPSDHGLPIIIAPPIGFGSSAPSLITSSGAAAPIILSPTASYPPFGPPIPISPPGLPIPIPFDPTRSPSIMHGSPYPFLGGPFQPYPVWGPLPVPLPLSGSVEKEPQPAIISQKKLNHASRKRSPDASNPPQLLSKKKNNSSLQKRKKDTKKRLSAVKQSAAAESLKRSKKTDGIMSTIKVIWFQKLMACIATAVTPADVPRAPSPLPPSHLTDVGRFLVIKGQSEGQGGYKGSRKRDARQHDEHPMRVKQRRREIPPAQITSTMNVTPAPLNGYNKQ
ncbi:hypothetical protein BDZ97DRAFT_1926690 [Flammula alnicola]|nr:hypothetical protein BDZ97DRAFT_1926690 [Flammula alnicola]